MVCVIGDPSACPRRCWRSFDGAPKRSIIVALACRNAWNPLPRGTRMFSALSNGRSFRLSKRFWSHGVPLLEANSSRRSFGCHASRYVRRCLDACGEISTTRMDSSVLGSPSFPRHALCRTWRRFLSRSRSSTVRPHSSPTRNWLHCKKCDVLWAYTPEQAKQTELASRPCPSCLQTELLTSVIVPPTWNKGIEAKFILPVWREVLKELTSAGRIFIIGYSFPESDQFFKYLLGLALSKNSSLTEIHVVSDSANIRQRFESLFHPYFHGRVVTYHTDGSFHFLRRIQEFTNQKFDQGALQAHFVG